MTRMRYSIWPILLMLLLFIMYAVALASNAGKGDYEPYNSKKLWLAPEAKSMSSAKFFTGVFNRAPAHDTPASACKCSKYIETRPINL